MDKEVYDKDFGSWGGMSVIVNVNTQSSHFFVAEDNEGIQIEGDLHVKFSKGNEV